MCFRAFSLATLVTYQYLVLVLESGVFLRINNSVTTVNLLVFVVDVRFPQVVNDL